MRESINFKNWMVIRTSEQVDLGNAKTPLNFNHWRAKHFSGFL